MPATRICRKRADCAAACMRSVLPLLQSVIYVAHRVTILVARKFHDAFKQTHPTLITGSSTCLIPEIDIEQFTRATRSE
eukprot:5913608-Amphidinium_carterae.1